MVDDRDTPGPEAGNAERYAKAAGGVFDIRNVIGALLGIYGVILVVTGMIDRSPEVLAKAGGNVNLWVGVALLVAAAAFMAWAWWRPVFHTATPTRSMK